MTAKPFDLGGKVAIITGGNGGIGLGMAQGLGEAGAALAIVGRNAFAHESGIHQDGVLKNAATYEIMTPESVGWAKTSLVMGKHSGRAAFRDKLKALGYEIGDNQLNDAFQRFKALADRKKVVYDEDIVALVDHAKTRS